MANLAKDQYKKENEELERLQKAKQTRDKKAEQKRELFNAKYPDFAINAADVEGQENDVANAVRRGLEYRAQTEDLGGVKAEEEAFVSKIKAVGE